MSSTKTAILPSLHSIGMILFMVLIAHGANIFLDGIYTDGWIPYHCVREGSLSRLVNFYASVGLQALPAYYSFAISHLGDFAFVNRLLIFCIIAVSNIAIYVSLRQFKIFSEMECVLCSIIVAVYSAYQIEMETSVAWYSFSVMFFYIGVVFYQMSLSGEASNVKRVGLQILGMFFIFISLNLNSLLVYYYFVLVAIHFLGPKPNRHQSKVLTFARHGSLYLLPLIYWWMKITFYPKIPYFVTYNQVVFSPFNWAANFLKFLLNGINAQIALGIQYIMAYPLLLGGAFILAKRLQSIDENGQEARSSTIAIYLGIWLLVGSVAAYVLVGKSPLVTGWESRHAILMAFPVGIISIGLIRFLVGSLTKDSLAKRLVYFAVASLVFGFVVTNWKNTVAWQLNWIRDRALIDQLHERPEWKDFSVYVIRDDSKIPPTVHYHTIAYSGLFKETWGDESRVGFNSSVYKSLSEIEEQVQLAARNSGIPWILMHDFNPQGEWIALRVRRLGTIQNIRVFGMYYYYKYFNPADINAFLRSVFSIERISLEDVYSL